MLPESPLRTPRLTIRQLRLSDLPGLHEMQGDPEATRFIGGAWTPDRTRAVLEQIMANYAHRQFEWYAVAESNTDGFLGICYLAPLSPRRCDAIDGRPHIELGFRFVRRHWGQGYATEAAGAMLEWGFRKLDLEEIVSIIAPENVASERVLHKLGMQFRLTFHHDAEPIKMYAITRNEFAARARRA